MRKTGLRIALVLVAVIVLAVLLAAVILRMHPQAADGWSEFSIGPASGQSASIDSRSRVQADGLTLKGAIALAYDMPSVRVIGPARLAETRYAFNAVVGDRTPESLPALLRQELKNRLRLETHVDVRPFDVLVLTATEAPRLTRANGIRQRVWILERSAQLEDTSMAGLANALQGILGKPVIDETGIAGLYDLEFGWDGNRAVSVAAILRDRFGLHLSEGTRDMDALIVDRIHPDPALLLLEQIGRITDVAPPYVRRRIGRLFTID